jgi:uncharacterized protein with GYD domain
VSPYFNRLARKESDIPFQICDTLTNSCGADQTAKDTCAKAKTAADSKPAKTGGQADAFNAVFGIQTDFAAVAEVDDQGKVVASSAAASGTANASTPATTSTMPAPNSCVSFIIIGGTV